MAVQLDITTAHHQQYCVACRLFGCIANSIYFSGLAVSHIPTCTVIVDDRKHQLSNYSRPPTISNTPMESFETCKKKKAILPQI
jgi:hypothetical protein